MELSAARFPIGEPWWRMSETSTVWETNSSTELWHKLLCLEIILQKYSSLPLCLQAFPSLFTEPWWRMSETPTIVVSTSSSTYTDISVWLFIFFYKLSFSFSQSLGGECPRHQLPEYLPAVPGPSGRLGRVPDVLRGRRLWRWGDVAGLPELPRQETTWKQQEKQSWIYMYVFALLFLTSINPHLSTLSAYPGVQKG